MAPRFIVRHLGFRKGRIAKCTHGNSYDVRVLLKCVVNGRTTMRAEVERYVITTVTNPRENLAFPVKGSGILGKPCLHPEHASCATLALETMANGYAYRVTSNNGSKLSAATRCLSLDVHGFQGAVRIRISSSAYDPAAGPGVTAFSAWRKL